MSDAEDFFADVEYVVEATSDERIHLYTEFALNRANFTWDSYSLGLFQTIGTVADRPICLSVNKAKLIGHYVAFWEMTSALQDFTMAEDFLRSVSLAYGAGRRTNVANFGHCLSHLTELNGESMRNYPVIWDYFQKRLVTQP